MFVGEQIVDYGNSIPEFRNNLANSVYTEFLPHPMKTGRCILQALQCGELNTSSLNYETLMQAVQCSTSKNLAAHQISGI
jgi:hypothetical protein